MKNKSWLFKELKKLRKEAGLTTWAVAKQSGVASHASILRWESGEMVPRADNLDKVLKVYGYELDIVKR